jgi:hypothetical protein
MDCDRRPSFRPGWDVHPIQAARAFRDRDGIEAVRLVAAGADLLHIRRADGRVTRHLCYRADEVVEFLAEGDGLPALFNEAWRVLAVVVGGRRGEAGGVTVLGALSMENGAAAEMCLEEGRRRMLLFCVASSPEIRASH